MSLRIRMVSVIAVILVAGCFVGEVQAWPWSKKEKKQAVKYEDSLGWVLSATFPGPEAIVWYNKGIYKQMDRGGDIRTIEVFEYMKRKGEEDFLTFRLVIPENLSLWWGPKSRVTISYTSGKDTLQATSLEYCFQSLCSGKAIISTELDFSGLFVPPANCVLFSVPQTKDRLETRLNPIIFVRFPHFSKTLDKLIACTVDGVLATSKEVSKR